MSGTDSVNHYETVGIIANSTPEQIRAAVKEARKTWVLRQNAPTLERRQEAETMLAKIANAERVLLDPHLRKTFDQQLHDRTRSSHPAESVHTPEPNSNRPDPEFKPPGPQQPLPGPYPYPDNFHQPQPDRFPVAVPHHPQGGLILGLGIGGFFCGVLAPVAWILGSRALGNIRETGSHPPNERQITLGRTLGIVGTALVAFWLILQIIVFVGSL